MIGDGNFLELFQREIKSGALDSILNQIQYVLVDEYQDTNPIQEDIFFHLAKQTNICVVGDDDQALSDFRTVPSSLFLVVNAECISRWKKTPARQSLLTISGPILELLIRYEGTEFSSHH